MALSFTWDPAKATRNLRQHGVALTEAQTVFDDPLASTAEDREHSTPREQRFWIIGQSDRRRTLVVIYSERGETIRIISAREATAHERETYEEGS